MLEVIVMSFFLVAVNSWVLAMNLIVLYVVYSLFCLQVDSFNMTKTVMSILSLWLILMMLLSVGSKALKSKYLFYLIIWLLLSLQICFYSKSIFWFYLSFEMSVLPILLIILGWGYQPDRFQAGIFMICYTILFSLPFLVGLFILKKMIIESFLFLMIFMMAFMVKLPIFGLHLWLPRAHVEAPVYGSMILAGVMLKLGGYGVGMVSFWLGDLILRYNFIMITYSLVGGLILSLICFVQTDIKLLVAYSSVVHMSLVISGLLTMKNSGLTGSICMMVGHGFCSSGLFYLLGINYDRFHSRSIFINKGLINLMPSITLWWFLFCSSNLSFPPSLNLGGELLLFTSVISWSLNMWVLLFFLSFFSSMYSVYLFAFSQHGIFFSYYSFELVTVKEYFVLFLHWVPLNLMFLDLFLFFY